MILDSTVNVLYYPIWLTVVIIGVFLAIVIGIYVWPERTK